MPVKRKNTMRRRKSRRGGTRKQYGGAPASPIEILAGIFDGLARIANEKSLSIATQEKAKILLGYLAIAFFGKMDESNTLIGGGDGNEDALTTVATPRELNAATLLIAQARRDAAAERTERERRAGRTGVREGLWRTGAVGFVAGLAGIVVAAVGTMAQPSIGAEIATGDDLGLTADATGVSPRTAIVGAGITTALAGLALAIPAFRTYFQSARDESVAEAPTAAHADALARLRMAEEYASVMNHRANLEAGAKIAVAAIGGATATAGTALTATGAIAGEAIKTLGTVGAAGVTAAGVAAASALRRPNVHTTTTTTYGGDTTYNAYVTGGELARRLGNAPAMRGSAGGVSTGIFNAAGAAAGVRRRANSNTANIMQLMNRED